MIINKIRQWPPIFSLLVLKAGGVKALKTYLRNKNYNRFHILSRKPPVIIAEWGKDEALLHQRFSNSDLVLLYLFPWCLGNTVLEKSAIISNVLKRFPRHRIVCLCNEEGEADSFRLNGIEAIFFNHNALANEDIYDIPRATDAFPKKWDALYNATISPYKRIELASSIEKLCIISYKYHGSHEHLYQSYIENLLPNAYWANKSSVDFTFLSAEEVNSLISQSHTGLCLSEAEGAMYASIEYLLSGVPVVSTPSSGGRDVFFNDDNSIICSPDPDAVREAVLTWKARDVNPRVIRDSALSIMHEHRARLSSYLAQIDVTIEFPWSPPIARQHIDTLCREIKNNSTQTS